MLLEKPGSLLLNAVSHAGLQEVEGSELTKVALAGKTGQKRDPNLTNEVFHATHIIFSIKLRAHRVELFSHW